MTTQTHKTWTLELIKAVAHAIFTDQNINPGKDTTKALVKEITEEIGLKMTVSARAMIWECVKTLHQSEIIEGRAAKRFKKD